MATENALPSVDYRLASRRLSRLRRILDGLLANVRSVAIDAGDEKLQQAQNAITQTLDTATELADWVEDRLPQYSDSVKRTIRENPLPACALAVGTAALLLVIMSNRGR